MVLDSHTAACGTCVMITVQFQIVSEQKDNTRPAG